MTEQRRSDEPPEIDEETIDRMYRDVSISQSLGAIGLARSRDKKIAFCAEHLIKFYSDHSDLALIASVLRGEKIKRPRDYSYLGVQIRVDEIKENEEVSFEEAVERYASRANMSVSAVKKAITSANKGI